MLVDEEVVQLLSSIDTTHVTGLRDRALIATMLYTFGRVGAVTAMNVRDYFPQAKRWFVRLQEKNGKQLKMPVHSVLESYLDDYLTAAGISDDGNAPLFQSVLGKTKRLTGKRILDGNVLDMLKRRARDAGVETAVVDHSLRATGITNYLSNGGLLEKARIMAGHLSSRTTQLYDRRSDEVTVSEIEKVMFEQGDVRGL